jgi:phosphoglycolate phosphatase
LSHRLPRCLLFDLDGTVLDSLPGIAFSVNAAFLAAGLAERTLDLRKLIGPPIRTILSRAAETEDPSLLDALEQHFRASYDSEGWLKTVCFEGVQEVLQTMKQKGHRLFVVSNKPRHISVRILEAEGIAPFFEKIYTRDSRQPPYISKEDMLHRLLVEHQLDPQDCVMIGDTMEDASASAMNKIGFVFMEHGYGTLPLEHPVVLKLGRFSEFLPYLAVESIE